MALLDARRLAESLVGKTLPTPTHRHPNTVLRVERTSFFVATEESPDGEPVSLEQLQRGLDLLVDAGSVRIAPETFGGYRRSSAIGAALAMIPSTELTEPPTFVRMSASALVRDQLAEACTLMQEPRTAPTVAANHTLYQLMVHGLPGTIRAALPETEGYKVQGSAGQLNFPWAETPWVAVLDPLVTESAQRGHYVVFLVHPQGDGVFLSLNQAVTEVRAVRT